ncbi:MAG: hypothetical protein GX620_12805 [Chloroflexi bacterium]|nr:hypothetical protein [Chloroflexota bacterium]
MDNGVHRIVYFAFGFEAINDAAQRRAVMHRVLDFLNPCDIPAQYGIGAPGLIVGFGEPGETVTHTVPISNRGLLSDAYSLSMSQPVWTTTLLITATPGISAGTQFTVPVVTLIPGSAIVGAGDTVTLTVTSVQSPTHTARVVIHTAIGRRVYVPQVLRRWSPLTSDWTG